LEFSVYIQRLCETSVDILRFFPDVKKHEYLAYVLSNTAA